MKFWVLVKRDRTGKVISLYSPDLNKELLETAPRAEALITDMPASEPIELSQSVENFRLFAQLELTKSVTQAANPITAKKRKELPNIALTPLDHWECFEIEGKAQGKFFAKLLPGIGNVFNVLSYITGGFITYMALRIASSSNENSNTSTGLSIVGTLFSSTILLLVYIAAGTSQSLAKIGESIDQISWQKLMQTIPSLKNYLKYLSLSLLAWGCTTTAISITGIRLYQEIMLLTEKYLNLNPNLSEAEHQFYLNLIRWSVVMTYIISGGYCSIAFQGSFAMKLVQQYTDKPTAQTANPANPLANTATHERRTEHEHVSTSLLRNEQTAHENPFHEAETPSRGWISSIFSLTPRAQRTSLDDGFNSPAATSRWSCTLL